MQLITTKAALLGLLALVAAPDLTRAADPSVHDVERSKICMLEDKVQEKAGIPYAYEGKTYFLCCPMCKQTFASQPDQYSKARDPVTGQMVDKATAPALAYGEQAYFFQSTESRDAFAKDPGRYAKASR